MSHMPYDPDEPSITCPECGMTSYNLNDVYHGYCGKCHVFLGPGAVATAVRREARDRLNALGIEQRADLYCSMDEGPDVA